MSTSAELQATWVINGGGAISGYAAGSDKNSGVDAAHPLRTSEELRRRLGPSPLMRVPTLVTVSPAGLISGDYLNLNISIGPAGNFEIAGDRGAALATGTFSSVTPSYLAGTSDQTVTATGLGSFVDKQIAITASGTGSHVGAIAHIAKDLGGGQVRTSPFGVPTATGADFGIIVPSVGDTYAVYDLPIVPVGGFYVCPGSNVLGTYVGAGSAFCILRNVWLKGPTDNLYGSMISSDLTELFIKGSIVEKVKLATSTSITTQCAKYSKTYLSGGYSFNRALLIKDNGTFPLTQLINSHYMDAAAVMVQGGSGFPVSYNQSVLVLNNCSAYDSAGSGIEQTLVGAQEPWIESNLWGSGHAAYGVRVGVGSKIRKAGNATITGALGDIGVSTVAAGVNTVVVKSWADVPFLDAWGTGIVTNHP